ncbi:hypothetical protein CL653_00425 [bacterium]|nr:hypothetical protein [bacterium]
MRKTAILRIRLITGLVLGLALILLVRLYFIQIVHHEQYVEAANKQYVHTVNDLYERGNIFFVTLDGEKVSAATIRAGYVLAVNPTLVVDAATLYNSLQPYLSIGKELFIDRATLESRTYVEIEDKLDNDDAIEVSKLNLTGVSLYKNQWRYYPGETMAARTIGFTGLTQKSDKPTGRYGLERFYESTLNQGENTIEVNLFAEIFSNIENLVFQHQEDKAGDIVTTLEPTVSRVLQQTLQETHTTWNSKVTGGIIINPKTGAIYALDAVPTFDLNNRNGVPIEDFRNPLVENVYEFGSIIKPLTMASGIDDRAVSSYTTYYDAGQIKLDDYTISNYDGRGRGTVDMQEVLNQSLNTGVAFVVQQMGKTKFRDYFLALGLGTLTNIDLPNEATGLVSNLHSPRDVEYVTASFGQGIALTPVAAVRALSSLANGGKLITPHLVERIEYQDGTRTQIEQGAPETIFAEETSEEISRMLTVVVDDALRDGIHKQERYSVAAKTGTAQIADEENGGYYDDRYLHSFFGYFPSYDPEFLIFLYTVEPKEIRYASETLTEPFMDLTNFLINYYQIPPDR